MKRKITVLLIEDDADYATLVQAWLARSQDVEFVMNWTDTLADGLNRIAKGGIDVILLDLYLPDSSGPETFQTVFEHAPEAPLVLLSGDERESLALDLVAAGAQDYLVKSGSTAELLIRAILFAMTRQPREEGAAKAKAGIVGLLSARGGVGATTLACILAAELRRQSDSAVLLVDLDLHAQSVALRLGLQPEFSLLDALDNADRLDDALLRSIVTAGPEGFDVLAAPALHGQEEPAPDEAPQLLQSLAVRYSWMVLDLGRLNRISRAALDTADQALLSTSTDLPSLRQTREAVVALRATGFSDERLRLAVTELPNHPRLPQHSLEEAIGAPVSLYLAQSSEAIEAEAQDRLPKKGSRYRESVAQFVQTLPGLPQQKPHSKSFVQMFGWR